MAVKITRPLIKLVIISILAITGIVVGFAVDPTTIPINWLWAIFIAALFIASVGSVLLVEAIVT